MRPLARLRTSLLLVLAVLASCTAPPPATATPAPTRTPDIGRTKLDIVYSALVDIDVHKVSSRKVLEAGLEAVRAEVRSLGGKPEAATPDFQDVPEPVLADFKKFADAVSQLAARAPELTAERISRAAIIGMIRQTPDCHTYYIDGRRNDSRPIAETGTANPAPPEGRVIAQADEAGLTARILDGGIAYVRWREFRITGTYDIRAKVKAVLETALAAGAKAWLFDMRGNIGGNGPEVIASYFLEDEAVMEVHVKTGKAGVRSANPAFRLPDQFQLPIALIQNGQGGSAPEILALFLKETERGTVVGQRSVGCVGATSPTQLPDGTALYVAAEEYVGAITGTRYNNVGVSPDVEATDAAAVAVAAELLHVMASPSRYDQGDAGRSRFLSWARVYVSETEHRDAIAEESAGRQHMWTFLQDPASRANPRFAGFYGP